MLDKIFTKVVTHSNPFTHEAWQSGSITFYKTVNGTVNFNGVLSFRKGATTGQQSFESKDYDKMLADMKSFLDNLENS